MQKTVYFVRHAQSEGNVLKYHQSPETQLSESGIKQLSIVAERFKHIPFDTVISSHYQRAQRTAEAIARIKKLPVVTTELLAEVKKPSVLWNKAHTDPTISDIKELLKQNQHNPDYKHSDEETFTELIARGNKALSFIEAYKADQLVCVTHGHFLAMLLAQIVLGEYLEPPVFHHLMSKITLNNTGITVCQVSSELGWELQTLNDRAHLG